MIDFRGKGLTAYRLDLKDASHTLLLAHREGQKSEESITIYMDAQSWKKVQQAMDDKPEGKYEKLDVGQMKIVCSRF